MTQYQECAKLSEVNSKLTKEVLTSILSKVCDGKKVQLIDWTFNEGSSRGDNYLSNVYKGKINGAIDGDPKKYVEANIVVKSMPKNPGTRKTLRCADFFSNEIAFYTEIVSKFDNFLAEKGQSDLLHIPRYIISCNDSEYGFIVLEDASSLGFHTILRENCLDWEEFSVVLKILSKFHAISFAYKDQRNDEFLELTNCVKEVLFATEYWDWYKGYHEKMETVIKHALAAEYPDSKADKRYNSYKSGELFNICIELCKKQHAPTSIINEGDCWVPNFLIRDEQNGKQAIMLDFQLARCASPITDLSFLIYACTSKSFRDKYFDEILKMYHTELSNIIKLLGSDPEKLYPWDLFIKEVKEQSVFGVFAALDAIPLCLMDVSEFSLDNAVTGDEAVDCGDAMHFSYIATASGRQRIADVIVEAVEKGYI
ncbi:hypothetical protein PUN28_007132 [Cardiocondyla obscurior]|uniref:CHK kinase-like domain-containing protein n=1 Tax=Cardiocondyla obscurior TaxID=286306 RepID=A0AAW2G596_9HYME